MKRKNIIYSSCIIVIILLIVIFNLHFNFFSQEELLPEKIVKCYDDRGSEIIGLECINKSTIDIINSMLGLIILLILLFCWIDNLKL